MRVNRSVSGGRKLTGRKIWSVDGIFGLTALAGQLS